MAILQWIMEDAQQRSDEIESLLSIYPDLMTLDVDSWIRFEFKSESVLLRVKMTDGYPSSEPPIYELSGPFLTSEEKREIQNSLNEEYVNNMGGPVLFSWVTALGDYLTKRKPEETDEKDVSIDSLCTINSVEEIETDIDIKHGEVFSDRKSHFQAHVAVVHNKSEVDQVLRILKSNTKIARATHNIYAYRYSQLKAGKSFHVHDCEDDGEFGASSKMLELLHRIGANNVIVIVSRWYGGIHLGPDRFRHINNLTREILVENGFGKVIEKK